MITKTRGIVIKVTNYAENSVVVQIFTEEFGLQSYIVNGAKKPRARIHINMLQPLHLLEMVVDVKETSRLQRIKEAQQMPVLQEIPLNIIKSSITLFLNEILFKVLKHQQPDTHLFHFIHQSLLWLDQTQSPTSNFHLCFLMKLSRFLGYLPSSLEKRPYFDLAEGVFTHHLPAHSYVLHEPHTSLFHGILNSSYDAASLIKMKQEDRVHLLRQIINFYRLHTDSFGTVNSLEVLEDLFRI